MKYAINISRIVVLVLGKMYLYVRSECIFGHGLNETQPSYIKLDIEI